MCTQKQFRRFLFVVALFSCIALSQADPVLYLPFDDDTGPVIMDHSEFENHGSASGDPVSVEGSFGMGMLFDAVDDQVVVPSHETLDITDTITLSVWAKPGPNLTADWRTLVGKSPTSVLGQTTFSYDIRTDNTGRLQFSLNIGDWQRVDGPVLEEDTWYHIAGTYDGQVMTLYLNGESFGTTPASGSILLTADPVCVGNIVNAAGAGSNEYWSGVLDEVLIYNEALAAGQIQQIQQGRIPGISKVAAVNPLPEVGASDVSRDTDLSWTSGEYAAQHDVYLGISFDDVNEATPADAAYRGRQDLNRFDPGVLTLGETYYWRIDEVNAPPDSTVYRGQTWNFEVEPVHFPVPLGAVSATASSFADPQNPENTVNGSGLDAMDAHGTRVETMWLADSGDATPWIQYEFAQLEKLDMMQVWNHNSQSESLLGFGTKEARIEYSVDGTTWSEFDTIEIPQAPGTEDYIGVDINLDGIVAKTLRITPLSNWGLLGLPQRGLSEVRFFAIPMRARLEDPAAGTMAVAPQVTLHWRAGREAAQHDVLIGSDPENLSLVETVDRAEVSASVDLDTTVYWQINEVNDAGSPAVWEGELWSFDTVAYLSVDDMESYSNEEDSRIFNAWVDGYENPAENGALVGSNPMLDDYSPETEIVHTGSQSLPLHFDNTAGVPLSEATQVFAGSQDWSQHDIQSLSLYVHGHADNTAGQLYVKINNTQIYYEGLADVLLRYQWIPFNIDLMAQGLADLTDVKSLTVGIEGAGAAGVIYIDDIRLYPRTPETVDPVIPNDNDPNLVAHYEFEGNADDSRGNYPGTAEGDPEYGAGKIGQALNLDGTDDHVLHAFNEEVVWPAFSVSLWTRTDFFGQPEWHSLFNNNSSTSDFQIDVDGTNPGNYRFNGLSGQGILGPVTDAWVHLAVSCDGSQTALYYNGLMVGTLNSADTLFGQIAIGINRGMTLVFAGTVDDVRVYDRALSYGEVAGLAGVTESIPKPL